MTRQPRPGPKAFCADVCVPRHNFRHIASAVLVWPQLATRGPLRATVALGAMKEDAVAGNVESGKAATWRRVRACAVECQVAKLARSDRLRAEWAAVEGKAGLAAPMRCTSPLASPLKVRFAVRAHV